ncbi:MAG: hypothetical protein WBD02_08660, partial [Acidimicrobiia bacterium]
MRKTTVRRQSVVAKFIACATAFTTLIVAPAAPATAAIVVDSEWNASTWASDFASSADIGPTGIVWSTDGSVYVANFASRVYRITTSGGSATGRELPASPTNVIGLAISASGRLYGGWQTTGQVVELDKDTGAVVRVVAGGGVLDIAFDPISGDLFAGGGNSIRRISNLEGAGGPVVTSYAALDADGIRFALDGTLFGTHGGPVFRIAGTNQPQPAAVSVIANVPGGDGIAIVTPTAGQPISEIVVNRTDGRLTRVNIVTGALSDIITGAGRGDLVATGPDGCLYATQPSSILKVTRADGSCPFQRTSIATQAGPDQVVPEGSVVQLAGSAAPAAATTTYKWETVRSQGPPVRLSSTTEANPTFTAFDDGKYVFRLTATNGAATSSDEVIVQVTNTTPVVARAEIDPAATDGLAELTVSVSDPGAFDTHTLSINWGDGTPIEIVPVKVPGSGWGYGFAGHIYATTGDKTVTVIATDNNGGVSPALTRTFNVGAAGQGESLPGSGVFAASQTAKAAIKISGSSDVIRGLVHSNNDIVMTGSKHALTGGTEYRTTLTKNGSGHTINPAAVQKPAAPFPTASAIADYAPGGRAALAAGARYFSVPAASCKGGSYTPAKPLTSGLYYVPCGVKITGSAIAGQVTIAASRDIQLAGSAANLTPFSDGVLFISGSTGTRAVQLTGSGHTLHGSVIAPSGGIDVSGSSIALDCGVYGQTVDMSGSSISIAGLNCGSGIGGGTVVSIAAPPMLVANLVNSISADKTTVKPGDTVTYTATVKNGEASTDPARPGGGASLFIPVELGADNREASAITVSGVQYSFEVHDPTTGAWSTWGTTDPTAPSAQKTVQILAKPNARAGVTYPTTGNQIDGTTVAPGGFASWAAVASIQLTPQQVAALMNPAKVDAIRNTATVVTTGRLVRRIARFAPDPLTALRAEPFGDVTNVQTTFTKTGGSQQFNPTTTPALARLTPGQSVALVQPVAVPSAAPKGDQEPDDAYLARLRSLDRQKIVGSVWSRGNIGIGPVYAAEESSLATVQLPIVEATVSVAPVTFAGQPAAWSVRLANTGSAPATNVAVTSVLGDGTPLNLTTAPVTLAPGQVTTLTGQTGTSAGTTTSLLARVSVVWGQSGGAAPYGPVAGSALTVVKPELALQVSKTSSTDPQYVAAGNIVYNIVAYNGGATALSNVRVDDALDPAVTIVPGTLTTQTGTIITGSSASDRAVSITLPTLAPASAITISYTVSFARAPAGTARIVNQAIVRTTELAPVRSDDPNVVGAEDPTVNLILPPGVGGGSGSTTTNTQQGVEWSGITPSDGTVITSPAVVNAALAPRGVTTSWAVTIRPGNAPVGSPEERVIASGVGAPPGATPGARVAGASTAGDPVSAASMGIASIDPTVLSNGGWVLRFVDVIQNGTTTDIGYTESTFIVDGQYKPGRYQVTYEDMDVALGGTPMRVLRTYDSLERLHDAGLGFGWSLGISNFRVSTTGPLGQSGWSIQGCGGSAFIVKYCFATTRKHAVSVTWPDGRTETFDYTPSGWSIWPSVESAYVAGPRTTSKLEP